MFAVLVFKAAKLTAFGFVKSSLGKNLLLGYGKKKAFATLQAFKDHWLVLLCLSQAGPESLLPLQEHSLGFTAPQDLNRGSQEKRSVEAKAAEIPKERNAAAVDIITTGYPCWTLPPLTDSGRCNCGPAGIRIPPNHDMLS